MRPLGKLVAMVVVSIAVAASTVAVDVPAVGGGLPTAPVTLTEPPAGLRGHPLWDSYYDLEPFGYTEQEFFVGGTATTAGGTTAPFTTRIIVTRPADAADFSGTVYLDWVNVTAQFENAVDTMLAREYLMREGHAYVHVSAQAAGICCVPALTAQGWDPIRYASLSHPGDEYAFSIFTQIARAFRSAPVAGSLDPMGSLGSGSVEAVIAMGQSQSGIRLYDYVNSWLPDHAGDVGAIDGFLVHGNVGQPKTFDDAVPVPVLNLLSDFEAVDDGLDLDADLDPNVRVWEIAGAAHSDLFIGYQSIVGHGPRVALSAPKVDETTYRQIIRDAGNFGEALSPFFAACVAAGTSFPMRYATSTALDRLDHWVRSGEAPPNGPRYQFSGGTLARDSDGNALGGIRLPPIDVPIASYRSTDCFLGGITVPFLELDLISRYGDHATYYAAVQEATDASVAAGWLLPEDAADLLDRACAARIRFLEPTATCAAAAPGPDEPPPNGEDEGDDAADEPVEPPADSNGAPSTGVDTLPATGAAPPLALAGALASAGLLSRRLRRV